MKFRGKIWPRKEWEFRLKLARYPRAMQVRVRFTPQLRRFLEAPPTEVEARTPREALEVVFAANPRLRSYLLDEQGQIRKHVALFIGGELARDPAALDLELQPGQHLDLMQALSGG